MAAGFIGASAGLVYFIMLVAVGAFGPGVLRQFGLLRYQDEFQRQVSLTAGYHAYLTAGVYAVAILLLKPWMEVNSLIEAGKFSADSILLVMLITYMFSYLFQFWGAPVAVFRILLTVGGFLLVFVGTAAISFDFPITEVVKGSLLAIPVIILAVLSRRFPLACGILLIAGGAALLAIGRLQPVPVPQMTEIYRLIAAVPILLSGIGLLASRRRLV